MRENGIEESIDRPLTIALVVDTVGNQGNGTSNSAAARPSCEACRYRGARISGARE